MNKTFGEVQYAPFPADRPALLKPSERIDRASLYHLTYEQQDALLAPLDEFSDVFSKTPGLCKVFEHEIRVTPEFRPRITKAYLVPESLKREIERQVDELLKMGFITPSKSPMASGVVCV